MFGWRFREGVDERPQDRRHAVPPDEVEHWLKADIVDLPRHEALWQVDRIADRETETRPYAAETLDATGLAGTPSFPAGE